MHLLPISFRTSLFKNQFQVKNLKIPFMSEVTMTPVNGRDNFRAVIYKNNLKNNSQWQFTSHALVLFSIMFHKVKCQSNIR